MAVVCAGGGFIIFGAGDYVGELRCQKGRATAQFQRAVAEQHTGTLDVKDYKFRWSKFVPARLDVFRCFGSLSRILRLI